MSRTSTALILAFPPAAKNLAWLMIVSLNECKARVDRFGRTKVDAVADSRVLLYGAVITKKPHRRIR
jgi:hypothetical protein